MATWVFSDDELERLRGVPELTREEWIRSFTLTPADVEFIDPGRGRGPGDRFGLAVARCRGWGSYRSMWVRRRRGGGPTVIGHYVRLGEETSACITAEHDTHNRRRTR
jgi:hypothetical protein